MSDQTNSLKLKPLGDNVILEPISDIDTTHSGIIIPETVSKGRQQKGRVLAVGPGRLKRNGDRAPMNVTVGDVVVFAQYAEKEVKLGDREYMVVGEDRILAIIEQ